MRRLGEPVLDCGTQILALWARGGECLRLNCAPWEMESQNLLSDCLTPVHGSRDTPSIPAAASITLETSKGSALPRVTTSPLQPTEMRQIFPGTWMGWGAGESLSLVPWDWRPDLQELALPSNVPPDQGFSSFLVHSPPCLVSGLYQPLLPVHKGSL